MIDSPDDLPGEAGFREEFGPHIEARKERWRAEAIRPTLIDAVEGRRGYQGFPV